MKRSDANDRRWGAGAGTTRAYERPYERRRFRPCSGCGSASAEATPVRATKPEALQPSTGNAGPSPRASRTDAGISEQRRRASPIMVVANPGRYQGPTTRCAIVTLDGRQKRGVRRGVTWRTAGLTTTSETGWIDPTKTSRRTRRNRAATGAHSLRPTRSCRRRSALVSRWESDV